MAITVTWEGQSSVTAASSIDSDVIALGNVYGFSAIGSVLGGSPNGVAGNLAIAVSNSGLPGSFVSLVGDQGASPSNGITQPFTFSYLRQFFNYALLRWVQTGPYNVGTLLGWEWSVTAVPPTPPQPVPVPIYIAPPAAPNFGAQPLTASQLTGYFNSLFPSRWVAPQGNS